MLQNDAKEPRDGATDLAFERTRLAYERTLLSWIRRATSLITFGFAIQQFFRIARAGTPDTNRIIGPHGFGLLMVAIGLLVLLVATLQHRRDMQALQARDPAQERPYAPATGVAALIAVLGLLGLVSRLFHE
jgi:putative membrane protein